MLIRLSLVGAVSAFGCGVLYVFCYIPALIIGAGIFLLFIFGWVYYIPQYVRRIRVIIGDECLAVSRGVFIHRTVIIPNPKCVYCEHIRSPLMYCFRVESVRIKLIRRSVIISGLSKADAELVIAQMNLCMEDKR